MRIYRDYVIIFSETPCTYAHVSTKFQQDKTADASYNSQEKSRTYRMKQVRHSLLGPMQLSWQNAPHFLHTIMALRLQEQVSLLTVVVVPETTARRLFWNCCCCCCCCEGCCCCCCCCTIVWVCDCMAAAGCSIITLSPPLLPPLPALTLAPPPPLPIIV